MPRRIIITLFVLTLIMIFLLVQLPPSVCSPVFIEFDIQQDKDLILLSVFGEPPQFAIWLEDPIGHQLKTVFVTYRSALGDWIGKVDCPDALPRWFQVFQQETNSTTLPTIDNPAPEAVTGATPKAEHFKIRVEAEPQSRWICWIEMNLAGDFNEENTPYNREQKKVDKHLSGQPPLLYRAEIIAVPGREIVPELFGMSVPDSPSGQTVQPIDDGITTARHVFKSINIRVIQQKDSFVVRYEQGD